MIDSEGVIAMKFRFLAATALLISLSFGNGARAEFTSWQDSNYDFSKVKTIYVAQTDMSDAELDSLAKERTLAEELPNKLATVKNLTIIVESTIVKTDLFSESNKNSEQISGTDSSETEVKETSETAEETQTGIDETAETEKKSEKAVAKPAEKITLAKKVIESGAEVFIQPRLHTYGVATELIPAHTEWRTRRFERSWVDKKGHVHRDYYTESYPYFVPDTYVGHSLVSCSFEWYDVSTGDLIATSEDSRDRRYSDDPIDVYQRIVDRFVKNLKKTFKIG